jgi:hypothetical protein
LNLIAVEEALSLELINNLTHGILVLSGLGTAGKELEALFHLSLKALTELVGRGFREAINAGGDSALVSEITRDFTLVLGSGATDEG